MRRAFAVSLAGLRTNLLAGAILWGMGSALLAAYWLAPAARPAFDHVASWQSAGGLWFSAGLMGVTGGLIPFLVTWSRGRVRPGEVGLTLAFLVALFAWRGAECDLFYRLQSLLFGDGNDWGTLVRKAAVDQLLYTAFWTVPSTTLAFIWFHDCHRDGSTFRSVLTNREFWRVRLPALVMTAWTVWVPMVFIINSLPAPLRIGVLALASVFWALCVDALAGRKAAGPA